MFISNLFIENMTLHKVGLFSYQKNIITQIILSLANMNYDDVRKNLFLSWTAMIYNLEL